nr:hypothetical protein [Bacteroidota bacterium]
MKILIIVCITSLITVSLFAQVPQAIHYQTVARDTSGNPLVNQSLGIEISIMQGDPAGPAVYVETYNATTNEFGLATIKIGMGTVVLGNFADIPWSEDRFFLQLGMDTKGGTDFKMKGNLELLSVPYALYADSTGSDNDWLVVDENMSSTLSGNVGIGTDIPGEKLSVIGAIRSSYDDTETDYLEMKHTPYNAIVNWGGSGNLDFRYEGNTLMTILQNGSIGIGANYAASSALLQLNSNTQGFRPPKMSASKIAAIVNPKGGLIVFNNTDGHYYVFRENHGNVWQRLALDEGTINPPFQCGNPFLDERNNKTYGTIWIGEQCWMTENLDIGDQIPGYQQQSNNGNLEKYCYDELNINCETYGGLYQWGEVMQYATTPGGQGICPEGWHIPSDEELCTLENYVDAGNVSCASFFWRGTDCGLNLKALYGWNNNGNGTDAFDFTALPGGAFSDGNFTNVGDNAYFWSSTESDENMAGVRILDAIGDKIGRYNLEWDYGFSVRCMYDELAPNEPPEPPSSPTPGNGATNQSADTDLGWICSDPEGDPLNYDVLFGLDPNPPVVASGIIENNYDPGIMENGTVYYWKIIAHDDHGNTTEGPVWSFEIVDCAGLEPIAVFCINGNLAETGSVWEFCGSPLTEIALCDILQGTGPFTVCYTINNGPEECVTVDEGNEIFNDFLSPGNYEFQINSIVDVTGCAASTNIPYQITIKNYEYPHGEFCVNGETGQEFDVCENTLVDMTLCEIVQGVGPFEVCWKLNDGDTECTIVDLGESLFTDFLPSGNNLIEIVSITEISGNECYTLYGIYDIFVNIQPEPIANAGGDQTICDIEAPVYLNGNCQNHAALNWVTSGDGYFEDEFSCNTYYHPGTYDIINGIVNLYLDLAPIYPCYSVVTDVASLIIVQSTEAYAGEDVTYCQSLDGYLVSDASASNYQSIEWTTSGDGYFNDPTIINPTYFHGSSDLINGEASLSLIAHAFDPCTDIIDEMVLTIQRIPQIVVEPQQIFCQGWAAYFETVIINSSGVFWYTTNGTGYFENQFSPDAIYFPSPMDYLEEYIEIILEVYSIDPCAYFFEETYFIYFIEPPAVIAGGDLTFCESENGYHLNDATASGFSSVQWTTTGDGSFDDATMVNPVYFHGPLDYENGGTTLTLTAYPNDPCINPAVDETALSIQRLPSVEAGPDQTMCQGEEVQLSAVAEDYSSLQWFSEMGAGYFINPFEPDAVYVPAPLDYETGSVEIVINLVSIDPCATVAVWDVLYLYFYDSPYAYAGPDQPNLEGTSTILEGNDPPTGGNGLWSILSGEEGTIEEPDNPNSLFTGQSGNFYQLQWTITDENNCWNNDTVSVNFVPSWFCGDELEDSRDQEIYPTTPIGNQCWMGKNLAYLPDVSPPEQGSDTDPYYYVYGYNGSNVTDAKATTNYQTYGVLYNWPAATTACPPTGGWHLPDDEEIKVLEGTVDSQYPVGDPVWNTTGYRGEDAGENLKATSGWNFNGNGLDLFDFTALPGGNRDKDGGFENIGSRGRWWSSSEQQTTNAWYRKLYRGFDNIGRDYEDREFGYSVRCLWDEDIPNLPPDQPTDPLPQNGSTEHSINVDLSWGCTDPEGDPLTFDVYFGLNPDPQILATGISLPTFDLGFLQNNSEYFWMIVAHDDQNHTTEGPVWSFATVAWSCGEPLADSRNELYYNTVQINDQCWMAENLNIGDHVYEYIGMSDNGVIEKYCYFGQEEYCDIYGGHYTWGEIMNYTTTPGIQGICPSGWNLPEDNDWQLLADYLGGTEIAGGKLKSEGIREDETGLWFAPNTGANNNSGFTGLPAGVVDANTWGEGYFTRFWSSSYEPDVFGWELSYDKALFEKKISIEAWSVRCLKE